MMACCYDAGLKNFYHGIKSRLKVMEIIYKNKYYMWFKIEYLLFLKFIVSLYLKI